MTEKTFSIQESLSFGWKTFTSRFWFFVGAAALIMLVQIVSRVFIRIPVLGALIIFVVSILVSMGVIAFSLDTYDAPERVELKSLWAPSPFWKFVLAMLAAGIITIGPLAIIAIIWAAALVSHSVLTPIGAVLGTLTVIAILWAIYIGVRFVFVKYLVMDEQLGVRTALKKSYHLTRGNVWRLIGLVLLVAVINILGAIALVVGLLVTIPLTMFTMVHVYRAFEPKTSAAPAPMQND